MQTKAFPFRLTLGLNVQKPQEYLENTFILSVNRGLAPEPSADTKLHGCSNPLYKTVKVFAYGLPWWASGEESTCNSGDTDYISRKEPLKKEMATHSNILAWEIPWTEEPSGLQSMGPQRVGQDWATKQKQKYLHIICIYPPIYFKIIFRLLVIPNSSFALLGPSRIFFFFFFLAFSVFGWLTPWMQNPQIWRAVYVYMKSSFHIWAQFQVSFSSWLGIPEKNKTLAPSGSTLLPIS